MPKRGVVLLWIAGLTLVLPAVCSAQVYAGATVGLGGARTPIGSYAADTAARCACTEATSSIDTSWGR